MKPEISGRPGRLSAAKGTSMLAAAVVLSFGSIHGCTATVDKGAVRASAGAPESERVDPIHVAYNAALPTFVLAVKPFDVGTDGQQAAPVPAPQEYHYHGGGPFMLIPWIWHYSHDPAPQAANPPPQGLSDRIGRGLAAQLETALSNVENVALVAHGRGSSASLRQGEVGPFDVEGTVTEFSEVADANSGRRGFSFGWLGTVLGLAGGFSGSQIAGLSGAGIAAADPEFESTKLRRTGSVALDIRIVNSSGRILGSFTSSGTFTAESASSGFAIFGIHQGEAAFAQSALGQATRVALNDAVSRIVPILSRSSPRDSQRRRLSRANQAPSNRAERTSENEGGETAR